MVAATSSSRARRRPASATRAPSAASARAQARPMPLDAPVTSAVFPMNRLRSVTASLRSALGRARRDDALQLALALLAPHGAAAPRVAELEDQQERDRVHHPPAELQELESIRKRHGTQSSLLGIATGCGAAGPERAQEVAVGLQHL